jgi:hypothetical protein
MTCGLRFLRVYIWQDDTPASATKSRGVDKLAFGKSASVCRFGPKITFAYPQNYHVFFFTKNAKKAGLIASDL